MRWPNREHTPTAKLSRRGRAREQKLAIGRVKRIRFRRARLRAREAIEALGRLLGRVKRIRFRRARLRAREAIEALERPLGRVNRVVATFRPPLPETAAHETPTKSVRASVLSATLCLGVALLLVSGKIVEIADRLPLGPDRERWLEAATDTDRLANGLSLNRPYDLLLDLRGAGDEAGQQIDVIGDVEELLQLELDGTAKQPPDGEAAAPTDESAPAPREPASASPGEPDTQPGQPDTPPGQPDTPPGQPDTPPGQPDTPPGQPDTPPGQPDTPPAEPDTPPGEPDVAATTTATDATAATATTTSTTTTVPAGPPAYVRPVPVSAEAPLVTWAVGDSQAFYLGHGLRREGRLRDVTEITLDQRHSTGLARPSYFNWPVHFFAIAAHYNPEVVVATLGSNDWQSMTAPEGHTLSRGSDEWRAEWSRRLGVALDVLEAPHRQVIWVGLPPTRGDDFREGYAVMNQLAAAAVAERDFVTMIDIWDMFGGDEPYRDAVPPPGDPEGRPVDVRQQDGVHLNQAGSRWVVDLITDEIERIIARISPEVTAPAAPESQPEPEPG